MVGLWEGGAVSYWVSAIALCFVAVSLRRVRGVSAAEGFSLVESLCPLSPLAFAPCPKASRPLLPAGSFCMMVRDTPPAVVVAGRP